MRTLLAVTALLLAPSALLAQTASATIVLQSSGAQNCPVGIQAQHTPQGAVEQVGRSAERHQLGYNISLRAFDSRLIRQARITLRGIAGAQVLPAGASSESNANATESFTLTPGATPKATLQSVVYAEKLTGVRWVEVDELTYADGTQWRQTQGSVCRVAPNGFLLVNSGAQ
jgi:hypothetical protein